jgi:hypothetical protein
MASATLFGYIVKIKKVVPVSIRKTRAAVSCMPHTPAGLPTGNTRHPFEVEAQWTRETVWSVKRQE